MIESNQQIKNQLLLQEEYDLNQKIDTGKLIDAQGAGKSFTSPGWLTQLGRLWGGASVRRGVVYIASCLSVFSFNT